MSSGPPAASTSFAGLIWSMNGISEIAVPAAAIVAVASNRKSRRGPFSGASVGWPAAAGVGSSAMPSSEGSVGREITQIA